MPGVLMQAELGFEPVVEWFDGHATAVIESTAFGAGQEGLALRSALTVVFTSAASRQATDGRLATTCVQGADEVSSIRSTVWRILHRVGIRVAIVAGVVIDPSWSPSTTSRLRAPDRSACGNQALVDRDDLRIDQPLGDRLTALNPHRPFEEPMGVTIACEIGAAWRKVRQAQAALEPDPSPGHIAVLGAFALSLSQHDHHNEHGDLPIGVDRRFMKYDEYLAGGYPIGSGVAEGACRHLVKDRMELTGMRWSIPGAQAMLDLRAVFLNDDWEAFQQHRIKQERRGLYPYCSQVQRKHRKAA